MCHIEATMHKFYWCELCESSTSHINFVLYKFYQTMQCIEQYNTFRINFSCALCHTNVALRYGTYVPGYCCMYWYVREQAWRVSQIDSTAVHPRSLVSVINRPLSLVCRGTRYRVRVHNLAHIMQISDCT